MVSNAESTLGFVGKSYHVKRYANLHGVTIVKNEATVIPSVLSASSAFFAAVLSTKHVCMPVSTIPMHWA